MCSSDLRPRQRAGDREADDAGTGDDGADPLAHGLRPDQVALVPNSGTVVTLILALASCTWRE